MTTLIDTNIIIDVIHDDPVWADWSQSQLDIASEQGRLVINPIVYAELCANPTTEKKADTFLSLGEVGVEPFSLPSARLAGHAFAAYRARKGAKTGVLPDFFIGAQAVAEGWTLLTRDATRYRTYFPKIKLIAPN